MRRLLTLFFLLLFFLSPHDAWADEGWLIDHFHTDIAIQNSGEVRIVETIEVNFNDLQKHGIYRDIPYVYQGNSANTYTELNISSILQNNEPAKYSQSRNNGYVRLKIGDADKTISGKNIYTITYVAKGILRNIADHDELYWNVTGNNWGVPIASADASLTIDKGELQQVVCYQGVSGSRENCTASLQSPRFASFGTLAQLSSSEGMTIAVSYPHGIIPLLIVEKPKSVWEKFIEWPSLTTLFAAIVGAVAFALYRWYRFGRDYWFGQNIFGTPDEQGSVKPIGGHETVTVEFTPPMKLRPAEIGVLQDERADTTDIIATIIDLATRGYLTITEIPKKWVFGKVDYALTKKNKDASGLLSYESLLLTNLFKEKDMVTMSSLKENFYKELKEVKEALYQCVVAKKLFPSNPETVRNNHIIAGAVVIIIAGTLIGWFFSTEFIFGIDLLIGLLVFGILLICMAFFMPRRTAYGREVYRRIKGYRLFISTAETYRQRFFEKKNMFTEVLPYAITFGLTAKFAEQMKHIGLKPSTTGWYVGSHPMTPSYFASSMNDFSSSMSSAMASSPSSSGGFSGGSSGGGFGGGGGGSW